MYISISIASELKHSVMKTLFNRHTIWHSAKLVNNHYDIVTKEKKVD